MPRSWPLVLFVLALLVGARGIAHASAVEDAEAEMKRAKVALDSGLYEKAVGHYLIARALVPDASGPYLGLGLAYAGMGKCNEAIPALEEYLRRRKKDPFPGARSTLNACRERVSQPEAPKPPPEEPPSPPPEEPNDPTGVPGGVMGGVVRAPPEAPPRGHLDLTIEPVAGKLTINGLPLGERSTYSSDLQSAVYEVVVEKSGYETVTRMLLVQTGRTTRDKIILQSSAPRDRRRKAGAAVGVILAAGVIAGVIAIGVVFGSPKPEIQFSTVVIP